MTEYQIQASTRVCAATGRELRAGERVYSVLLEEAGKFVRKDYSEPAWQGPPDGAFSFWKTRLADGQVTRRPPIDDELLLECFRRLEGAELSACGSACSCPTRRRRAACSRSPSR